MELPENWGTADIEVYSVTNLGNSNKPTVSEIRMFGEIRGEWHELKVSLVCSPKITTYSELAEEITYNCLYPWVASVIAAQDTVSQEVL